MHQHSAWPDQGPGHSPPRVTACTPPVAKVPQSNLEPEPGDPYMVNPASQAHQKPLKNSTPRRRYTCIPQGTPHHTTHQTTNKEHNAAAYLDEATRVSHHVHYAVLMCRAVWCVWWDTRAASSRYGVALWVCLRVLSSFHLMVEVQVQSCSCSQFLCSRSDSPPWD